MSGQVGIDQQHRLVHVLAMLTDSCDAMLAFLRRGSHRAMDVLRASGSHRQLRLSISSNKLSPFRSFRPPLGTAAAAWRLPPPPTFAIDQLIVRDARIDNSPQNEQRRQPLDGVAIFSGIRSIVLWDVPQNAAA
jgi:hypothetical protein